jgi:RNA recognition motif-containing protein
VGNLLYHAKPADIESLFSGASDEYLITRISMSLDPFTGRNPSYCFVELADRQQAERAMARLDGVPLLGRPVKIKPCVPKNNGGRGESDNRRVGPGSPALPPNRWERTDAPEHWRGVSAQGRRLHVCGLPRPENQADSEVKIRALFGDFKV